MGILKIAMKMGTKLISKGTTKLGIKSLFKSSSKQSVFNFSSKNGDILLKYINEQKFFNDGTSLKIPKRGTKEFEELLLRAQQRRKSYSQFKASV